MLTVLNKMAELRASDWLCPNTLLLILQVHRRQWEGSPGQHGNEIKSWLVFTAHLEVQTALQSLTQCSELLLALPPWRFCQLSKNPFAKGSATSHPLSSLLPFPKGSLQEFL